MKLKSIFSYSFLAITVVMFISSCSTTVEISKRHYNSGFYVDISSKKANAEKNTVQARSTESVPVEAKVESSPVGIVASPAPATEVKKNEIKKENASFSYAPLNKKEKISKVSSRPGLLASAIKIAESKAFTPKKSSRLEASQTTDEAGRYLLLWLVCLLAAIVFAALGIWVLYVLAFIAFIVFFVLWLINI